MTNLEKLKNAVVAEIETSLNKEVEGLQKIEVAQDLRNCYLFGKLTELRKRQYNSGLLTLDKMKSIIEVKLRKEAQKAIAAKLQKIEIVENAPDFKDCTITVEWTRSQTWGSNLKASIKVNTSNNYEYHESGSIGGCGYDKESTATSNALNQCPSILKMLYIVKNEHPEASNRELIGYGSGYGILPAFEGGVGISTMNQICESIGCEFKHISGGKTFDVYEMIAKTQKS